MTTVVNLRAARKRRQREEADAKASENRVRHGLPKAARVATETEAKRVASSLDGHRLTSPRTPDTSGGR